ncbi:DUF3131 domain-containing protein [Amylibacter sp. SFDW26]|uniref:DUF3131 domain-containing protein n=1 Tax=Amylibacter sp. SFDW26 TaxID=2652722 RepID=UPI001261B08D|nr:DUF3131 domain-containing protein [Amylibacter sp. SFDW26]KAB7613916.1 DUF3131 domain-containing protein [Amylibacter sp. SFDW26]
MIKTLYIFLIWVLFYATPAQAQTMFNPKKPTFTPLTTQEQQYAQTAWAYFAQNTDTKTGLVPSVRKFQSMTMWDQGGYLMAVTSAYKLGIISRDEATGRMLRTFNSVARLPLYQGQLPNKAYNITSLTMTDYANKPTPKGIGWSALDIMRFITGMLVVTEIFPELLPYAHTIISKWDLSQLTEAGRFRGLAVRGQSNGRYVQEGRIGYEQYAGRTGLKIGLPVKAAAQYEPILRWQGYYGLNLPGDARTAKTHGVSAVTTSEPFLLEALEMGWRDDAFWVAQHVFDAQIFRYNQTGQITALSEDHIKGPPYFAYNAILVDHAPFKSVTARRVDVSDKRTISTKASFGWWATIRHPYAVELIKTVEHLQTDYGWYAGLFEADMSPNAILTLNTNAVVLEALHYKAFGPHL